MAKPKTSRQKQNTSRQNQKPHSKIKIPHDKIPHCKTKYFTAKANSHSKTKAILPLLWSIWFWCEVFGFAVRYFVFAMRFLVLPWCILFLPWFLVLPWQLWATVWYQLSMKSPLPRALLNRTKDFFVLNTSSICYQLGSPVGVLSGNGLSTLRGFTIKWNNFLPILGFHVTSPKFKLRSYRFLWVSTIMWY